ncbi:hypothetical protein B566_EDAN004414 [Ephemera danica]|nr:hypothetical protein B566_EDAN004414 [Ephemera danica]
MDVDSPSNLKRSSSAPMINELNSAVQTSTSKTHNSRGETDIFNLFSPATLTRTRRFSASCSPLVAHESPRLSSARVTQLRREERPEAVHCRELEHERELHSQMQMSQSCEDLAILPALVNNNGNKDVVMGRCSSPSSPVQSAGLLGSFSPTRDRATPTRMPALSSLLLRRPLSPSPTRKTFMSRRSLSPIAMRPSALTPVKRKFDLDHSDGEQMNSPGSSSSSSYLSPPAKRLSIGSQSINLDGQRSAPLSPGGGRFLFRPLTSSHSPNNPSPSPTLVSNSSSLRDEPMTDVDEEMLLVKPNKQSSISDPAQTQQPLEQQNSNNTIKDAVMSSFDPS